MQAPTIVVELKSAEQEEEDSELLESSALGSVVAMKSWSDQPIYLKHQDHFHWAQFARRLRESERTPSLFESSMCEGFNQRTY